MAHPFQGSSSRDQEQFGLILFGRVAEAIITALHGEGSGMPEDARSVIARA